MGSDQERLSVVLFAAERMTRRYPLRWLRIMLCKRLLASQEIEIKGVFIDKAPPKKVKSEKRLIKKHGEARYREYLAAKQEDAPDMEEAFSYQEACESLGLPFYEVDLNSEEALEIVKDLEPDLGLLFGCRILKEPIITLPRFGTLNFHARDAEQFRGGGALGYWELLEGVEEVQITIHKAVAKVDAGAILKRSRLRIEDCDTLESLLLKTVLRGVGVYAQTILDFARGQRDFTPQSSDQTKTYRRDLVAETIYRKEREQILLSMPRYRGGSLPELWAEGPKGLPEGLLILGYPAISNSKSHERNLPFEVFFGQMQWLKRHINVVSLGEALTRLEKGETLAGCAVITLDGGFRQDLQTVLPCLEAFEFPATFFLGPRDVKVEIRLCGQTLMGAGEIRDLAARGPYDFGVLRTDHFEKQGAAGFDRVFEEQLRVWTGKAGVGAALPYGQADFDSEYPGLCFDNSGLLNRPETFDGARLSRVLAPSSVADLAALFSEFVT